MEKYNHKLIEEKWQKVWADKNIYDIDKDTQGKKGNFYLLDMFPYPSGDGLHMGHTEGYTATDILYRYKKMSGYNVLHPQGFDSFGLPAENYAIKTGTHPTETTKTNSDTYLEQLKMLGLGYDFKNIIHTSNPDYYKWTQWLFGQFFQNNLVYKKTDSVNWCDSCNTILANEQVEDGACERCKTEIIQKEIPGWFFRITDFADELIDGLDTLDWPESTKKKQINWIGKSEGAEIDFKIQDSDKLITAFTTRPDTLFGATYMVLAPEHLLVKELEEKITNFDAVQAYIADTSKKTELDRLENKEKTGVQLQGVFTINPANQEEIPVFIADYVLANYGTGAIMAVPAHDERDFEFAQKFGIPKRNVIWSKFRPVIGGDGSENMTILINEQEKDIRLGKICITDEGILVNSRKFDGMTSEQAKTAITEQVGGRMKSTYRLRDWSLSRQRYWGCPIPIVYSPTGEATYVGDENLPWLLPTDVDFVPTGISPLTQSQELQDRVTNLFGEGWTAEYDTMDTFVDSSWYFMRYPDTNNNQEFCSEKRKSWLPVDLYIGGAEHTYMHLLYARFFTKAMNRIGLVNFDEPFLKFRPQGMVNDKEGRKMSKSKGNVVNPNDMVERFGSDAVRTFMMFAGPLEDDVIWNEDNIVGVYRFLEKVWSLQEMVADQESELVEKELHKLIKAVGEQINALKYNTAVSDMMKFVNTVNKEKNITQKQLQIFTQLLSPYAPHIADDISHNLGGDLLLNTEWPEYDTSKTVEDMVTIGVQINGKRRGDIEISVDSTEEESVELAKQVESISKWMSEGEIKKVIYVPGKILNIIIG